MKRERIHDFIRSFRREGGSGILHNIESEAREDGVPIIREETRDLLRILLEMKKPERILEVGTAIGFSSVFMAEYTPDSTLITTIENEPGRYRRAEENIKRAGMECRIRTLFGDARDLLETLEGSYDFVFMDAAKGQYIHFLPPIMKLLASDGILVSDNVLQDGDLFESRYGIRRRDHTIHHRMREYLYALTHHDQLDTVILECGDGMSISVRTGEGHSDLRMTSNEGARHKNKEDDSL